MHFGDRNIHINNVTEELNHCEIVSRWLMVANGGPTIFAAAAVEPAKIRP